MYLLDYYFGGEGATNRALKTQEMSDWHWYSSFLARYFVHRQKLFKGTVCTFLKFNHSFVPKYSFLFAYKNYSKKNGREIFSLKFVCKRKNLSTTEKYVQLL